MRETRFHDSQGSSSAALRVFGAVGSGSHWRSFGKTLRDRWIDEGDESVVEETGGEWFGIYSHDLRRSWAAYHFIERQVNVLTMVTKDQTTQRAVSEGVNRESDHRDDESVSRIVPAAKVSPRLV